MFDLGFLIFTAVVSALLGLLLGYILLRVAGKDANKARELNKALEEAEAKNAEYQQNVAEHFSQTAVMLNDLTEKYKDVHHHLAHGAEQLCRDSNGQSLLQHTAIAGAASASSSPEAINELPQPPLDYAPKSDSGNVGTLAEDYGLEKVDLHQQGEAGETPANDTPSYIPDGVEGLSADGKSTTPPNVQAI